MTTFDVGAAKKRLADFAPGPCSICLPFEGALVGTGRVPVPSFKSYCESKGLDPYHAEAMDIVSWSSASDDGIDPFEACSKCDGAGMLGLFFARHYERTLFSDLAAAIARVEELEEQVKSLGGVP